jgi:hypothetical protein
VRPALPPPWEYDPRRPVRAHLELSFVGALALAQSGGFELLDHGVGFAFRGGLDFGRHLGIEAGYLATFHNPLPWCADAPYSGFCATSYLVMELVTFDLKLRIPTHTRFVPYAIAGGAVAWIRRDYTAVGAMGGGFQAGAGIDIWIARHLTLGARVLYRGLWIGDWSGYSDTDVFLHLLTIEATIGIPW